VPPVAALGELSGSGTSGQVAYWTSPSQLAGFPSRLNVGNNSIALGLANTSAVNATVGGGSNNTANASGATIAGGLSGSATGTAATVGGGSINVASAQYVTIGGGERNAASSAWATIGGGRQNAASSNYSTVGGGLGNTASGPAAFIGGGGVAGTAVSGNVAAGSASTIGGGVGNVVSGDLATVGGGTANIAGGAGATIGGGGYDGSLVSGNIAIGPASTIGGGTTNTVTGAYATIGGGRSNFAGANSPTIGGGSYNAANANYATVGGGFGNQASAQQATVGGGVYNVANASGATVPGGTGNWAGAAGSLAAGTYATVQSGHHGAILFSDDTFATSGLTVAFTSHTTDEFAVRATGGVRFVTGIDSSGNTTQQLTVSSSGFLGVTTSGASTPEYAIDLRTPGKSSAQMHIAPTGTDSGGYLTSANPGNLFMSAGAAWNGSAWVAKNSTSYQYGGGTAGVRFFFDTGLTVGGTYMPTTRMFIGPTGNVGIGMSTQPGHLLQLGLDDAAKPSTSTWTIASDGRLKDPESIEPFTEGAELIKQLPQPVWFRYRNDSGLPSDRRVAGWIAQDIAAIAPFMIRRTKQRLTVNDQDETETLSLNTNELPYAMLNSIKEILQRQEEMLTRLEEKEQEIRALKAETNTRFEKVENRLANSK
jgi:hypothetical protein